ncbi:MAG TPA: cell wall-binding repeat-containing protein [Acidimicrobiales bacterium]|nr:cell wall-binding repeat-containing protein [Acidimicrobiales bacterium]
MRRFVLVLLTCLVVVTTFLLPGAGRADAAHTEWDEWDFLRLINKERWQNGLAPLSMVPPMRDLSRSWSSTMSSDGVLRHDPNLQSGIAAAVPDWIRMGENVGYGSTGVLDLHRAFMASEGHRSNILRREFTLAGIGVRYVGTRLWVTVKFASSSKAVPTVLRAPTERVSGSDDVQTSVNISRRRAAQSAPFVVVARDDDFADALTGGALASIEKSPLLLTQRSGPSAGIVEEAKRVIASGGTVQLLGGNLALAPAVQTAFTDAGLLTERLAGPDRYATAAAVAARVKPDPTTVVLVSGLSYPDALVAAAPAGRLDAPVLLVSGDTVPAPTTAFLETARPERRIVLGGTSAVGAAAASAAGATERVSGTDRFGTAAEVMRKFFPTAGTVSVASGLRYEDALMAGPEAARLGAPVMLSAPGVPAATYAAVAAVNPRWGHALVVGGTASVTPADVTLMFS